MCFYSLETHNIKLRWTESRDLRIFRKAYSCTLRVWPIVLTKPKRMVWCRRRIACSARNVGEPKFNSVQSEKLYSSWSIMQKAYEKRHVVLQYKHTTATRAVVGIWRRSHCAHTLQRRNTRWCTTKEMGKNAKAAIRSVIKRIKSMLHEINRFVNGRKEKTEMASSYYRSLFRKAILLFETIMDDLSKGHCDTIYRRICIIKSSMTHWLRAQMSRIIL